MNAQDIVKKHSKLILYNETKGLSAVEQKLFIYCIAKAVRANDIDTFHSISIREFTGKKNPSIYDYRKAKKALFALQQMKPLYVELDGKFKSIVIFPTLQGDARSIDNDKDIDKIELAYKLNDELKPLIIDLKEAYTEYLYSTVSKMKSSFAIRLYEILLQQAKFNKPYSITVDNLKIKFGIQDVKTYGTYSQFKRAVIEKSISEINEKTDISGYYEEEKQGKKVYKLTFFFTLDSTHKEEEADILALSPEELLVYNVLPDEKTKQTYLKQIGKLPKTSSNTKDVQTDEIITKKAPTQQTLFDESTPSVSPEFKEKLDKLSMRLGEIGLEKSVIKVALNKYTENPTWKIWPEVNNVRMAIKDGKDFPNKHTLKKVINEG
ncbi:replication initiation protein [Flammeovirga kamogawensis]|uniref:Replication initiation protein n=1 Tax=Flammeovirga kamogawensis TaxID=373891 RepID=A0ABX8H4G4_9BACT|nr:replication initiation protein [Flammeovirga kamogawensis]MBB6463874.1 plasmid replication initiation protein [Flammeovirga kamogawensis]QWG10795.1 replication initiation protein [Flammeovirga kamogawensis]TRX63218.1 replication initiation protein [Flammeovirga kamogawensis]